MNPLTPTLQPFNAVDPRTAAAEPLLALRGLAVEFTTNAGRFRAVDGVTLDVPRGRTVALVGESGLGQVGDHSDHHATAAPTACADRCR